MPCSGPSQDAAYNYGEKVYQELIQKLITDRGIFDPEKVRAGTYKGYVVSHMLADYVAIADKLKESIKELIWDNDCASF